MKLNRNIIPVIILCCLSMYACVPDEDMHIKSPDEQISVSLKLDESGKLFLDASFQGNVILHNSRLGIIRSDADFSEDLKLFSSSQPREIREQYTLLHGKRKAVDVSANQQTYSFVNKDGLIMDVIVRVSNDGFAFRYHFPEKNNTEIRTITKELTSFHFAQSTTAWIQPRATAKSGWKQVNPSYEEHYWTDIPLSELQANDSGWVFPVLLKTPSCWVNLTESWPSPGTYCGSHLNKGNGPMELTIAFPESSEGFPGKSVYPESVTPWTTPWRIITLGTLKTLAESTVGTDVADPSRLQDTDYIVPGRASWSWALMKDASVNFSTQAEFIKYAAAMNWEYCLIDVNWDTTITWAGIEKLAELADTNHVSLILWYNSAGDWNTTPYHPKHILTDPQKRKEEFARLHELGIRGIKVDFFGGDGQSMMDYYCEILEDAHAAQLMVNCHGATLPRGLHHTYPNLVSMESVRGFEYATFGQETADRVAIKATILPFTRNIFDPMDFTPVCFTEYDNNERITGNAAELAQAVLFLSGVQHYAETPRGMKTVPDYVRQLMKEIPVSWDETVFIDGYPGSYVVMARRSGNTWYIVGINADKASRTIEFTLPFNIRPPAVLITEDRTLRSFQKLEISDEGAPVSVELKPNGGFVMTCSGNE